MRPRNLRPSSAAIRHRTGIMAHGWAEKLPEEIEIGRRKNRLNRVRFLAIGAAGGLGLLAAVAMGLFRR